MPNSQVKNWTFGHFIGNSELEIWHYALRFQVPQFIETETKIIGPFTLKQFLFLAAGGVILFIVQNFVSQVVTILIGIPVLGIAAAMAFYKIDGVPLPQYILLALSFLTGTKRYQFKKETEFPIPNSQFPTKK